MTHLFNTAALSALFFLALNAWSAQLEISHYEEARLSFSAAADEQRQQQLQTDGPAPRGPLQVD